MGIDQDNDTGRASDPGAEDTAVRGEFRICDARSANWLVRKIVEARAYRERIKAWAERETRRTTEVERRLLFLYGAQLQAWVDERLAQAGGRRRSLGLPAGQVGYRKTKAKLLVEDLDAVLHWARTACPQVIQMRERLDQKALADHFRQTGEVPEEGVRLEPERDKFFIK